MNPFGPWPCCGPAMLRALCSALGQLGDNEPGDWATVEVPLSPALSLFLFLCASRLVLLFVSLSLWLWVNRGEAPLVRDTFSSKLGEGSVSPEPALGYALPSRPSPLASESFHPNREGGAFQTWAGGNEDWQGLIPEQGLRENSWQVKTRVRERERPVRMR